MHRVLSFQMARGFGESSEFVTKRMCFSFLFSVGFLCLLCGFLTGHFAAGRASDLKAEKTRLEHAGNGLVINDHLREFLVQRIHEHPFNASYFKNFAFIPSSDEDANFPRIKKDLQDLRYFNRVVESESYISATIRGSQEPDRYVILAATNEGIPVILELSRVLKSLNDDFEWSPRRTIIFIAFSDSSNFHQAALQDYVRDRTVAYIELDLSSISGSGGYFAIAGSDIVQSSILQAAAGLPNPSEKSQHGEDPKTTNARQEIIHLESIPRLRLDVPSALVKFVSLLNRSSEVNGTSLVSLYRQSIGEIIGTSIWRLSEMMLLKWDPTEESKVMINILRSANSTVQNQRIVKELVDEIKNMTENVIIFNEKIEQMDTTNPLPVRVANDLSMQYRRLLLCSDKDLRSRTDWFVLKKFNESANWSVNNLRSLTSCYKAANEILQEHIT